MFQFIIQVTPDPEKEVNEEAQGFAGAFACVWIDFKDLECAEVLARFLLEGQGWLVQKVEKESVLTLDDYDEDDETGPKYHREAEESGYCLAFFLYPEEEEEEGDAEETESESA